MCEFCKGRLSTRGCENESPCLVKDDTGKYQIYVHGIYEEYYDVNYCPICGRKLVEE